MATVGSGCFVKPLRRCNG